LGVAVGVGLSLTAAIFGAATVISWAAVALSLGCSVLAGVAFGIYPALRAGRLEPVEALQAV
jgi:putative ABC transport system permease protein